MKRGDLAVLVAAISGGALARLLTHYALGDVPHVMDEVAYWLQARMIASGAIAEPVHLPRAAFAMWFVDDRAATFGIFPPGWPAVLALGAKLGIGPWVNPLLHAFTVPLVARAGRLLGGPRARVAAAFAYALSPQAIFVAASFMSHALVALGAAMCLVVGLEAKRGRTRALDLFAAGAGLGLVLLARPLCAVVVATGLAAFLLPALLRKKIGVTHVLALAAPLIASVTLLGAYNGVLTGKPTLFPQTIWFDGHLPPINVPFFRYQPGCNELGFGPGHGCDQGILDARHTPANALSNTGDNLTSWTFLAGGGPLVFLGVVLALVSRRRRLGRLEALVIVPAAIALYALYWYAGTCYGARFYHAALPALVALGVVGFTDRRTRALCWGAALAWALLSSAGFYAALGEVLALYWGNDDRFVAVSARHFDRPALVMVAFEEDGVPMHRLRVTGFTSKSPDARWRNSVRALSALSENDIALRAPVIFAKYHPQLVDALRARFADRALYLYVMHADRTKDELVPFDGSRYAEEDLVGVYPPDNFDGYVVLGANPPDPPRD